MWQSNSKFDQLVNKATSSWLLEPDWEATIQICDSIRAKDVNAKYAVSSICKKSQDKNPHVSLYALAVLESVVKNCGTAVHDEACTKEVMEILHELSRSGDEPVRTKVHSMVQAWAHAFREEVKYRPVTDMYNLMRHEGVEFPEFNEADAMFCSESAPDWMDASTCSSCRVQFGTFTRQHHCRNCGQSFCSKCSSKTSPIPKFGIEKDVRVCDRCFFSLKSHLPAPSAPKKTTDDEGLPSEYLNSSLAKEEQTPRGPTREEQLKEEEELQLALAISQSEAESRSQTVAPSQPTLNTNEISQPPANPDLDRYLQRDYWEAKRNDLKDTAVTAVSAPVENGIEENNIQKQPPSDDVTKQIGSQLEIFLNRMRSNMARGRNISADSAVQSLYQSLANLHPQLVKLINENEETRARHEHLQDKLAQLRDTREALEALREDHRERKRQHELLMLQKREADRKEKLNTLRDLKQKFLLQRMQQLEQQRQQTIQQQAYDQNYQGQNYDMYNYQHYQQPIQNYPIQHPQQHQQWDAYNMQSMQQTLQNVYPQEQYTNFQQQQQFGYQDPQLLQQAAVHGQYQQTNQPPLYHGQNPQPTMQQYSAAQPMHPVQQIQDGNYPQPQVQQQQQQPIQADHAFQQQNVQQDPNYQHPIQSDAMYQQQQQPPPTQQHQSQLQFQPDQQPPRMPSPQLLTTQPPNVNQPHMNQPLANPNPQMIYNQTEVPAAGYPPDQQTTQLPPPNPRNVSPSLIDLT